MSNTEAVSQATRDILVKCGGFSTQLAYHIGEEQIDGHPLWGSRFDALNPTAVVQTHLDFLQKPAKIIDGAQIILSNTYQASVEGFMEHLNLSRTESIDLMRKSVQLAKEAKTKFLEMEDQFCHKSRLDLPLILASIGPYGAHLHDGSEYNGKYAKHVRKEDIQRWHRPRIEACLAEGVDGLAVETIPCQMEAEAVVDMILTEYANVNFWVSFQCQDEEKLANGDKFSQAVLSIWQRIRDNNANDRLLGIGVNCVNPKYVVPLFKSVHAAITDSIPLPPLIVYSNRGETYNTKVGAWMGRENCVPLESYIEDWIKLGARIIGGCCRVYPSDILRIRKCVDNF